MINYRNGTTHHSSIDINQDENHNLRLSWAPEQLPSLFMLVKGAKVIDQKSVESVKIQYEDCMRLWLLSVFLNADIDKFSE